MSTEEQLFFVGEAFQQAPVYVEWLPIVLFSVVPATSAGETTVELPIPRGAVVSRVLATITADAPGATTIGGIADVRAASGAPDQSSTQLVIDFRGLRTVSSLRAPSGSTITKIEPWVGTKFEGTVGAGSANWVDFTEVQTERLLVTLAAAITPTQLATEGSVTTTTPPADLEVLVGETRAWSRPGPAPLEFETSVDVTELVQAAVDAAPAPGPDVTVRITLCTRVPGLIGVQIGEVRYLRTHTVDFPGPTTTVRLAEEGTAALALPLPAGHETWVIHQVIATIAPDDRGPARVLPPVGPTPSTDAELVLDPDRRLSVRLPASALDRFRLLHGVRVLLTPGPGGIELGGSLLAGTTTEPGDAVPDAVLGPVTVPAASSPTWATLSLARPVAPPSGETLWCHLSVSRGEAVIALALPAADVGADAVLRRTAPNGVAQVPSGAILERSSPSVPAVPVRTDLLALRLIGEAPDDAPIELVVATVDGAPTPPPGAGPVTFALDPPDVRDPLTVVLTATAATDVVVGPVVVAYTDSGGPP